MDKFTLWRNFAFKFIKSAVISRTISATGHSVAAINLVPTYTPLAFSAKSGARNLADLKFHLLFSADLIAIAAF